MFHVELWAGRFEPIPAGSRTRQGNPVPRGTSDRVEHPLG